MAIIPQIYNDAVVAIGIINKSGNKVWIATGFIVARKNENGGYNTFLVTNNHVLANGQTDILLRFNISGKINAKDYPVTIRNEHGNLFSSHPSADVACLFLNASVLNTDLGSVSAFALDEYALTREQMLENEIVEGTIVYTLGFPSGLVGVDSKVPLCRMGCISKIKEPINEAHGFLLDIQNFPGSSGSPVINRIESNFLVGTKKYNSTRLIGIIAAYIPYIEELVSKQTGKTMQVLQENSGLAVAYTVDAIKEVVEIEFDRVKKLEKKVSPDAEDPIIEEENNEPTN